MVSKIAKMDILEGKTYTNRNTDLCIKIIKIYYKCDEYIKAKCILMNKYNSIIYDIKTYKLKEYKTKHWKELCNG